MDCGSQAATAYLVPAQGTLLVSRLIYYPRNSLFEYQYHLLSITFTCTRVSAAMFSAGVARAPTAAASGSRNVACNASTPRQKATARHVRARPIKVRHTGAAVAHHSNAAAAVAAAMIAHCQIRRVITVSRRVFLCLAMRSMELSHGNTVSFFLSSGRHSAACSIAALQGLQPPPHQLEDPVQQMNFHCHALCCTAVHTGRPQPQAASVRAAAAAPTRGGGRRQGQQLILERQQQPCAVYTPCRWQGVVAGALESGKGCSSAAVELHEAGSVRSFRNVTCYMHAHPTCGAIRRAGHSCSDAQAEEG